MIELEDFNDQFKNWLLKAGVTNLSYEYKRPENPLRFNIWLQYHLDQFGIQSIKYEMKDGKFFAKNIVYQNGPLGNEDFPYEIIFTKGLMSKLNSHFDIEEIKIKI